jgi:hypothetical protein
MKRRRYLYALAPLAAVAVALLAMHVLSQPAAFPTETGPIYTVRGLTALLARNPRSFFGRTVYVNGYNGIIVNKASQCQTCPDVTSYALEPEFSANNVPMTLLVLHGVSDALVARHMHLLPPPSQQTFGERVMSFMQQVPIVRSLLPQPETAVVEPYRLRIMASRVCPRWMTPCFNALYLGG